MKKRINEIRIQRKISGNNLKAKEEMKKLPVLPNFTSFKSDIHPTTRAGLYSSKGKKVDVLPVSDARNRQDKLKSFSVIDEDFEKLELISYKHQLIRNNSLSIQERLIEISSGYKLPVIKEINSCFANEKGLNSFVGSAFQKYNENLKIRLKEL